ncbi:MAG: Trehalose/maltose import ATP-binding protein MalK [Methanosaeta sp. PtaB.Bin039]|nr:MAG: Trehalose/maltose import ATP-binding protein MalK [Methanosaeta sp. PtaB.Bin039]HOT06181.1 ATP-binding cassette domain-containing protein [Methanotrichaceae archaeon]HQF15510.1 ATP-binding cassette domain-containing protein [Methanotrichaceae archaeon]HQI90245.1 ATP-binding cassette domain-containing protein [Methanotrichaceae archaeon]HQJ27786.1 ATP-binding cassette domain-containing protein [Methanotrichaceae archaeon]
MLQVDVEKQLRDFPLQVRFDVAHGEVLALVGENGCGKSTVLHLLAGLLRPDSGRIALDGDILFDSRLGIDLCPESRNIGYVFQNYALFPHLSVHDNVAFGLRARHLPSSDVKSRVRRHLEAAGLWELRLARADRISGGQKQRAALARALAIEPALLLLDEPFSALDASHREEARKNLHCIIDEMDVPAVMVTHDWGDLSRLGDRICLMRQGLIRLTGNREEFSQMLAKADVQPPDV